MGREESMRVGEETETRLGIGGYLSLGGKGMATTDSRVPPEQPTILDQWGKIVNGTAGPYEEGDTPSLTCRVTGGKSCQLFARYANVASILQPTNGPNRGDVPGNPGITSDSPTGPELSTPWIHLEPTPLPKDPLVGISRLVSQTRNFPPYEPGLNADLRHRVDICSVEEESPTLATRRRSRDKAGLVFLRESYPRRSKIHRCVSWIRCLARREIAGEGRKFDRETLKGNEEWRCDRRGEGSKGGRKGWRSHRCRQLLDQATFYRRRELSEKFYAEKKAVGEEVLAEEAGKPEPMVRWLVNGQVKDEEYEKNAGDVIENRLTLQPITRTALGANFTCQARNTDLIEPKEATISLDLNLKPLTATIRRPGKKGVGNESLLAGKRYEVECETTGSRPPAVITWYKGRRRQLKHTTPVKNWRNFERSVTQEERSENRTVSMVEFEPGVEDHGKSITCRAENPNVTGLFVEKSWKIDVVCKYTINIYSIALSAETRIPFVPRPFTSRSSRSARNEEENEKGGRWVEFIAMPDEESAGGVVEQGEKQGTEVAEGCNEGSRVKKQQGWA
ncbi:hypothetical protein WN48_07804 [Eufriesea mexicana]|uniref:Ig-like domain-containing protein n=1 Tax=Eufriesea mexicana TaxID=516756 RepID=A0A310SLK5_9HYME|nr:hypothetical protein WN48_07804 [Eufriesea mexicana]